MKIPFINIPNPDIEYFNLLLKESIEAGHYTNFGPNESLLTKEIADLIDNNYVVCSANATLILEGIYKILSIIRPKDIICLPSFTFPATCLSVINSHFYAPTYSDNRIGFSNFEGIGCKIAVTTAPFGAKRPSNYIRPNVDLWIVDNAAGATPSMDKVIDWLDNGADVVIVSLHATKTLSACEGGFVVFNKNQKDLYEAYRSFINFGFYFEGEDKKINKFGGSNHKMSELSASWARMFMHKIFSIDYTKRKKIADHYESFCKEKSIPHIYSEQAFWILHNRKSKIVTKEMSSFDIEVKPYYTPLVGNISDEFSIEISENGLCLPTWGMCESYAGRLIDCLWSTFKCEK